MFQKVLVANRGEIAVRIIRALRDLGVQVVAVYSEADREGLPVRMADEAYCLGPAPPLESYLATDKVVEICRSCGAEAIHPGYGFLAENPEFFQECARAGITLIGPNARAVQIMGSKISARQAAESMGVPIVPGATTRLASEKEIVRKAQEIGYPILLKADAGGGGKGMRIVGSPEEIRGALRAVRSEALSAFGDDGLYLEKYLDRPRHIEIQVLGDRHGNLIHLGERECSIQRRHQKVIEESPSPFVDSSLRGAMGNAAILAARAVGYDSAGTVEFLVDRERRFYFLEMNTRLQVEHPITEMVTGMDIVQEMIRSAAGEPLRISQSDVSWHGAAIECRIYAEDPENNFLP
ncbi:MAG: ATP-grasp domain-containing protein, partial [Candidatus Tectomicrobia bacterium]|nr:ATP-grasp domain-containing protein [Candidatus Tectomicrobia bacterium]